MQTKTLNMVNATGKVVAFTKNLRGIYVLARAECWVKLVLGGPEVAAPSAPVTTPAPATNATADYLHLLATESRSLEVPEPDRDALGVMYVLVWPLASGELEITGF